ncbi:MAG: tetratricopeptide repeat protein [Myxococcota bacterium]
MTVALLLPLSACSSGSPDPVAAEAPSPDPTPELALSYEPNDGATDRAIAQAQALLRSEPGSADAAVQLAVVFLRKRRETSDPSLILYAESVLRAARAQHSHHAQLDLLWAMTRQERHQFDAAARIARRVVRQDADNTTAHLILGDALLELGDYDGAADAYQRAIDLRPDLRSYNRGAHLRFLHGDFEGAVELIELAIDAGSANDPEASAWCFVDLGHMYLSRGDGPRALAAARRALNLVPEYAPALALEARGHALREEYAEAAAAIDRVLERVPTAGDLLFASEVQRRLGNDARADRYESQAERLSEDEPGVLAKHYARVGTNTARALALASAELEARRNIAAYDAHALALLRSGRVGAARRSIDRALQLDTPDAELVLHRALIELAAGDRADARASLEEALRLNPSVDPVLVAEARDGLGEDA